MRCHFIGMGAHGQFCVLAIMNEAGEVVGRGRCDTSIPKIVALLKPQFEVGRQDVGKGGIIRDPALHQAVCAKVVQATEALGFTTQLMESPILGMEGNREFLMYAERH